MDFMSTVKGSLLEGFYPRGWDMQKIHECCEKGTKRETFWNKKFNVSECENVAEFDVLMGHEIAMQIKETRDAGRKCAMILPVGPMGMYRWAVYFLREWKVKCDHVYTFNMDEWSDAEGNTLPNTEKASFEYSMKEAFFNKLGKYTVPETQRNFATKENLPTYEGKIAALKAEGAKLVLVYGIGRMCHIAFWEPQFADEFDSVDEWKKQTHRIAAKLHPLTIEQNAITSFKSRTTLVPCRANTIGPGLFLQADYAIGGADGALSRGMGWQGMSFLTTLHYGPDMNITSTFIPTLPGKLFYLKELKGPLTAECN
ncbi:MAG: glucosamine-6-phosphate isomerase [Ruminococcaceae bacterium]|nr:glucosamine-6-phosphate isomerase [Oscillospiraceae bacterium]